MIPTLIRSPFSAVVIVACLVLGAGNVVAQQSPSDPHRLIINADLGTETISRHIYGHFAEHLGRDIYDGFWTKAGTGEWHYNEDIIEALRRIRIPNLRWPGGCFADYYHWKDGIGPREERPTIVNTIWGGVTEDNSFGTHEFLELAERLDTEPFVVGNVGSGTVQEMADWWEYINFDGISPMADLRRENGREEPWGVSFWGVGNESWGCGGNMTPEFYADQYKRFQTLLRGYGGVRPFRIATGPSGDNYEWMEVMMREAGRFIDGIDLHHYSLAGSWARKGDAVDFTEAQWFSSMRSAQRIEEFIERHSAIMDQYDPRKRVWLIVGEWGAWHDVEEGTNPGFLYQQNTLRDAVLAAHHLNVFNNHADRVKMANIAQTINVLQAMILTRDEQIILTPTYHVFEMFAVHHDATLLPSVLQEGSYELDGERIIALSVSASQDDEGRIHITLVNMDPNQARTVSAELRGTDVTRVGGRVLTAAAMNTHNTFEQPGTLMPAAFNDARLNGSMLSVQIPAKSVVVLELQ